MDSYNWSNYRNYEVSVWTLQDDYITTLKSADPLMILSGNESPLSAQVWPQARAQGQIQNGEMTLNIDGTLSLLFDIPMYLYLNGVRIENPNWYNNINENVLTSMRKIKVIFDKWNIPSGLSESQQDEWISSSVFEFMITKVLETHENDDLVCHVECEGMPFNELGKVGYKRYLEAQTFYNEKEAWRKKVIGKDYETAEAKQADEPKSNLQYWMDKAGVKKVPKVGSIINKAAINPTEWYYDIRMAHSSMQHTLDVYDDIIYEEGVPSAWDAETMAPTNFLETREKQRLVDLKESNLYNITLDLAEKFGVFCRYEYIYDTNYHIIGRLIIFYNNFLLEGKDVVTLMYPNSANRISREMDSAEVSTKMFVHTVELDDLYHKYISIMDCEANYSREDYLMNFDYLHDTNIISDELYAAIPEFYKNIRAINDKLFPLLDAYNNLSDIQAMLKGKVKSLEELIPLAEERITEEMAKINAIDATDGVIDGYITRDWRNPAQMPLLKKSSGKYDSYYISFNSRDDITGVVPSTVKLYKTWTNKGDEKVKYALSLKTYSESKLMSKDNTKVFTDPPGKSAVRTNWVNYQFTFKGTIGIKGDRYGLPENPDKNHMYKVLVDDQIKAYKETSTDNWELVYAKTNDYVRYVQYKTGKYRWLILADTTDGSLKGTIGEKVDLNLDQLPSVEDSKPGWYYQCKRSGVTGINSKDGTIVYRTLNSGWATLLPPMDSNDPQKQTLTSKDGVYQYTIRTYYPIQGPCYLKVTCARISYDPSSVKKFFKTIEYVFYTTDGASPLKPSVASATSDATPISIGNVIDKWTLKLSLPDPPVTNNESEIDYNYLLRYTYYYVLRLTNNKGEVSYEFPNGQTSILNCTLTKDCLDRTLTTAASQAKDQYLQYSLKGTFNYKDGVLDTITGIFKVPKHGLYSKYGLLDAEGAKINSGDRVTKIDNLVLDLRKNATKSKMSSKRAGQYVIILRIEYHTNGNVTSSFNLKYYNRNGVEDTPKNSSGEVRPTISSIEPIFYLQSDTSKKIPKPTAENVGSNKVLDAWTTALPDKTKKAWTYYRGWKITRYNGVVTYHGIKKDTTLKKKSVLKSTDADTDIPSCIYATFKYKPSMVYEKVKAIYETKVYNATAELAEKKVKLGYVEDLVKTLDELIINLLDEKKILISKFEHMLGAALRESYWTPDNEYEDFGTSYDETVPLDLISGPYYSADRSNRHEEWLILNIYNTNFTGAGWVNLNSDDEQKLYYESSVNKDKEYYLCIDLKSLTANNKDFFTLYRSWLELQDNQSLETADEDADIALIADETSYEFGIKGFETSTGATQYKDDFMTDGGEETTATISTISDLNKPYSLDQQTVSNLNSEEFFAFFFNPSDITIPEGGSLNDIRYCKYYGIGAGAQLAFISTSTGEVKPVLILEGASELSDTEIYFLLQSGHVGKVKITDVDVEGEDVSGDEHSLILSYDEDYTLQVGSAHYISAEVLAESLIVYPRLTIPSIKVKTNSLVLLYNDILLKNVEDYSTFMRSCYCTGSYIINSYNTTPLNGDTICYLYKNLDYFLTEEELGQYDKYAALQTITIKPEFMYKHIDLLNLTSINFKVYYNISNADIDILLDAKEILKENAYPKVSYEANVSMWSRTLLDRLYTKLAQLVMINDTDLKLQNTFGYISGLTLNLDHLELDSVEIKNYKTKFEDLFSKIVAETEEMHKNSHEYGLAGAMASAETIDKPLTPEAFIDMLQDLTIEDYMIDFIGLYLDGREAVESVLSDLFTEMGEIINSAQASVDGVVSLTLDNTNILQGFKENIVAAMTPTVYKGDTPPANFKPGDIWISDDDTTEAYHVAMGYGNLGGSFVLTYEGALAEIKGSSFGLNAQTGEIDIINETNINLKSGKTINIAANDDVNIIGNKTVNIGGTTINVASSYILKNGVEYTEGVGGIHLLSTVYDFSADVAADDEPESSENGTLSVKGTSSVDIDGNGIMLASKNGIVIKSGQGIKIYSSNQGVGLITDDYHGTAAVKIDALDGIWLGSNKPLKLFSGDVVMSDDGLIVNGAAGANIELTSKHLLLGVSDANNSATAIELNSKLIILAAGSALNGKISLETAELNDDQITTGNPIAGVLIKLDYIGMAAQDVNLNWTLFSMNGLYITLGAGNVIVNDDTLTLLNTANVGSFVRIAQDGVYIGSTGNFYLNTNSLKILTNINSSTPLGDGTGDGTILALGTNLLDIGHGHYITSSTTPEVALAWTLSDNSVSTVNVKLLVNSEGMFVNGQVYSTQFTAVGKDGLKLMANAGLLGFYLTVADGNGGTTNNALLTMGVESGVGYIYADHLKIGTGNNLIQINSSGIDIGTDSAFYVHSSIPNVASMRIHSTISPYLQITSANGDSLVYTSSGLSVTGKIIASLATFNIGQANLEDNIEDSIVRFTQGVGGDKIGGFYSWNYGKDDNNNTVWGIKFTGNKKNSAYIGIAPSSIILYSVFGTDILGGRLYTNSLVVNTTAEVLSTIKTNDTLIVHASSKPDYPWRRAVRYRIYSNNDATKNKENTPDAVVYLYPVFTQEKERTDRQEVKNSAGTVIQYNDTCRYKYVCLLLIKTNVQGAYWSGLSTLTDETCIGSTTFYSANFSETNYP